MEEKLQINAPCTHKIILDTILNVESKSLKLLEENIGEYLYKVRVGMD